MNSYSKPIINPNKMTVSAKPKETGENVVENITRVKVEDKVDVKETISTTPVAPMTEEEKILDTVIDAAKQNAEENEDIEHIRDLQHKEYEDRDINELTPSDAIPQKDLPDGVIAVERTFPTDDTGRPIFTKEGRESAPAADLDILHVDDLDDFNNDAFKKNFLESTSKIHDISDEDALALLDLMTAYKKDKSISIYSKMPEGLKTQVKQICASANIPMSNANSVAKMMINELINETATDQTFIDFEKSIDAAMKIPSLIDLYEEHVSETVGEKLPAMAAAIKDEDPEKAQMLLDIAAQFDAAKSYVKLKECFDTNSRVRKLIRRDYSRWNRFAEELNFMNRDSKFRMTDATSLYPILVRAIADDPDNDIDEIGIQKFLVLLYRSCDNLKKDELIDASYIYYLLKDISMLGYINNSSSSVANSFSAELISNIKAMIYYITAKEEEFYASNKPTKRGKK